VIRPGLGPLGLRLRFWRVAGAFARDPGRRVGGRALSGGCHLAYLGGAGLRGSRLRWRWNVLGSERAPETSAGPPSGAAGLPTASLMKQ
jgi:hypothetical protein